MKGLNAQWRLVAFHFVCDFAHDLIPWAVDLCCFILN